MARANQAGSFGPSRTRTSLVVYRIAVATEGERQGISLEARSDCTVSTLMQIVCLLQSRQKKSKFQLLTDVSMRPNSLILVPLHCFFWPTPPEEQRKASRDGRNAALHPISQADKNMSHLTSVRGLAGTSKLRAASWLQSSCHHPSLLRSGL